MKRMLCTCLAGTFAIIISGCTVVDAVTFEHKPVLITAPQVGGLLPDRPLYIRTKDSPFDGQYLVDAFVATGLFSKVTVIRDPNAPADAYFLQQDCYSKTHNPAFANMIAWLFTAMVAPMTDHTYHTCKTRLGYTGTGLAFSYNIYSTEQRYILSRYTAGLSLIPFMQRGAEAKAYNPVAIANETVNRVVGGIQ